MFYIIYGKEREQGRARFRELREELGKVCGEEHQVLEGEFSSEFLHGAASSQGLFGDKTLFVFDCVFDKKTEQEALLEHASELHLSPNYFLVFEPEFDKKIIDEIKETKVVVEELSPRKVDARPDFNIFSLGDALGARNKKELWVLYQEALGVELSPEEICGTLFWAVRNIALMKDVKPGHDKGMSPFVAKKSREYAKNYSSEEIIKLSRTLTVLYHEAHRGGESMEIAIERFILGL